MDIYVIGSAQGRTRLALLAGVSGLALLLVASPALAQHVIVGTDIVDGSGDGTTGTENSPWNVGQDLHIGSQPGDNAGLVIQSGGEVSNTLGRIGNASGSEDTVTVTGAGSSWTNSSNLYVGYLGTGTLTIADGGTVSNTGGLIGFDLGSQGAVTVTGAGSSWANSGVLLVGHFGTGTLTIADGGQVFSSSTGWIGDASSSEGAVTVTGAGSSWANSGALFVGVFGAGTLTIEDGGTVSASDVTLGYRSLGTGTLTLSGASGTRGVLETGLVAKGDGNASFTFDGGILRATGDEADFLRDFAPGDVTVGGGGAFIDSNSFDIGIATDLQGSGGLTKLGIGSLTLTGNSAYSGGTTVRAGTLIVDGGSIDHAGASMFIGDQAGNNAGLVIQNGGDVSNAHGYIGNALGSEGTVTVTGAGSSWTNSDFLFVGGIGTGTLTVEEGGQVSSNTGWIGYFPNSEGTVTVTGAGSSWVNSFVLRVGEIGTGTLIVEDGGTVSAQVVTLGSSDTGTGTLTLSGTPGALGVLETRFVARGDGDANVTFDGGILRATGDEVDFLRNFADGDVTIAAGGAFIDSNNFDIGIATDLQGSGGLTKLGTGSLTLTGDSSGFGGNTDVQAGLLSVNGVLGGNITVQSSGTLGGSGIVGDTTIADGGTLAPGNSIGTLTVDGDLDFTGGSRFAVEVNPEGSDSDLVIVTGTATLNGGAVAHIGADGNYDIRSTYTILSAANLSGQFDEVTSNFAFLTPDLLYDYGAGTVDLVLARNDSDFASAAATRNQIATANGIESIGVDAGHAVFDAIAQLSNDGNLIRASFDALSGNSTLRARAP